MERKIFESKQRHGVNLKYLIHAPASDKKLPLLIYVHGAGGRGDDLAQLENGPIVSKLEKRAGDNCIFVSPQCHKNYWFELFDVLCEFIDTMRNAPEVDINRIYLFGPSMGGYTTWQLCLSHPDWFAAAIPICGGGMYWAAATLTKLPIWAFHGALDPLVLTEETIKMVRAINREGGNAKITIYPNAEHDAWTPTMESDEVFEWLFAQNRLNQSRDK